MLKWIGDLMKHFQTYFLYNNNSLLKYFQSSISTIPKKNYSFSDTWKCISFWINLKQSHTQNRRGRREQMLSPILHPFIPFVPHSSFTLTPLIHPSISCLTPLPLTVVWFFLFIHPFSPPLTPSLPPSTSQCFVLSFSSVSCTHNK